MKNKTLKTLLIIINALALIPVLGYLGICAQAYYMNINPDHVDLLKGEWKNILSFRTVEKNILVEIYGRPLQKPNSGEFVMVRKGVLPLGMNSVSKIYKNKISLWNKVYIECDSLYNGNLVKKNPPTSQFCCLCMEIGELFKQNWLFYIPTPTIGFCLCKACPDTYYKLHGNYYSFCDKIPFFCRLRKDKFDIPQIYYSSKNINIPFQLEDIFKKPKEE